MTMCYTSNVLAVMVVVVVIVLTIENHGPQSVLAVPFPGCCPSRPRFKRGVSSVPKYRPHPPKPNNTHRHHGGSHHHQYQQQHGGFSTNFTHTGGYRHERRQSQPLSHGTVRRPGSPGITARVKETTV
uniref:Secreted protein n=1 Tax=Rhipicephalus zambeziensis TaxID=60191 RepID=A0A224YJ30_9ACAR